MSSSNRARGFFVAALVTANGATLPTVADEVAAPVNDCAQKFESAQTLRKDGKLKAAAEALIACSQPNCPTFIAKECTAIYSEVQSSLPTYTLRATEGRDKLITEVRVYLDGELISEAIDGRAVPIDPGVHDFRFVAKGKPEQSTKVLVAEGEKNKIVSVDFAPPEERAAPVAINVTEPVTPVDLGKERKSGPPLGAYILGGVGLAAIGAGVVLRVVADKDFDDAERSCAPSCSQSKTDSIDMKYNLSMASFAVGGAAIVGAGVIWLVSGSGSAGPSTTHALSLKPTWRGDGVLAGWRGTF